MGERRLMEITSAISNIDNPVSAMLYITSLSDSDIYLLLRCVGGSKYKKMNFGEGLISFSKNYVDSKTRLSDELEETLVVA